jgi:integrase
MIDDVLRAFQELKKLSLQRKDRAIDQPNNAPDDVVFGIGDNKKWWEAALKEAKIKEFRWHDLRHTFCSRLAQAGVSLKVIQEAARSPCQRATLTWTTRLCTTRWLYQTGQGAGASSVRT